MLTSSGGMKIRGNVTMRFDFRYNNVKCDNCLFLVFYVKEALLL